MSAYDYEGELAKEVERLRARAEEAEKERDNVLDSSKEGGWMARALDAERELVAARAGVIALQGADQSLRSRLSSQCQLTNDARSERDAAQARVAQLTAALREAGERIRKKAGYCPACDLNYSGQDCICVRDLDLEARIRALAAPAPAPSTQDTPASGRQEEAHGDERLRVGDPQAEGGREGAALRMERQGHVAGASPGGGSAERECAVGAHHHVHGDGRSGAVAGVADGRARGGLGAGPAVDVAAAGASATGGAASPASALQAAQCSPGREVTLRQWMLDMTGPEDAYARDQYAALVTAAKAVLERSYDRGLYDALRIAGEIK